MNNTVNILSAKLLQIARDAQCVLKKYLTHEEYIEAITTAEKSVRRNSVNFNISKIQAAEYIVEISIDNEEYGVGLTALAWIAENANKLQDTHTLIFKTPNSQTQ